MVAVVLSVKTRPGDGFPCAVLTRIIDEAPKLDQSFDEFPVKSRVGKVLSACPVKSSDQMISARAAAEERRAAARIEEKEIGRDTVAQRKHKPKLGQLEYDISVMFDARILCLDSRLQ